VIVKKWKDDYIYTDMHELFFLEFPCLLFEWSKKKTSINYNVWPFELVVWDQDKIEILKLLEKKWT